MKKRSMKLVALLTVAAMAFALVGCSSTTDSTDSTDSSSAADTSEDVTEEAGDTLETAESIELRVMTQYVEGHAMHDVFADTVAQFEEDYSNVTVTVEYLSSENVNSSLVTDAASGNYPDIFPVWADYGNTDKIEAGLWLDLSEVFEENPEWAESFSGGLLDEFTYDGIDGYYGIPICVTAGGFFYNTELFEEAGAEVPETWDELLVVIDQLNDIGVTPWVIGAADTWRTQHLFSVIYYKAYGIDSSKGLIDQTLTYDDDSVIETFNLMLELVDAGAFDDAAIGIDYATEVATFASGTVGMQFNGSWAIGETDGDDTSEAIKGKVGFFDFPTINEEYADQMFAGTSDAFGLSAELEGAELEAAVELMMRLTSAETAVLVAEDAGCLPAVDVELDDDAVGELFVSVVDALAEADGVALGFTTGEPSSEISNSFHSYSQGVFGGLISPEDAAADLAAAQAATEY